MTSPHTFVSLRRDSVSVLLDASGGRLPALLHWGADLGPLHLDDARALGLAAQPLRQWLTIVHDRYLQAGWALDRWPDWMATGVASGTRASLALH